MTKGLHLLTPLTVVVIVFNGFCFFCSVLGLDQRNKSATAYHQSGHYSIGNGTYSNASALLESLLKDYDIRLRPQFGAEALNLEMDIIIASFDSISEVNMDYTITMYLHQYWIDERLSWGRKDGNESMTLSGNFSQSIWVPDTFLANDKHSFLHDVTETNKMLRLFSNGKIAYGMRFTSTLACHMNLRNYPLDAQNCSVEIESYGYTMEEVMMKWKSNDDSVTGVMEAEVPQFTILDYLPNTSAVTTSTGTYQRLSLVFSLRRSIGYFIFQTYLPCVLIVMLSWVSFWINHEATSARVALGITTVLTMTTISTGVRQSLPRISYVKSIDIYLVMCFVFVFAALLEYAAVNYSYWGERAKRKKAGLKVEGSLRGDDQEGAIDYAIRDWDLPSSTPQNDSQSAEPKSTKEEKLNFSIPSDPRQRQIDVDEGAGLITSARSAVTTVSAFDAPTSSSGRMSPLPSLMQQQPANNNVGYTHDCDNDFPDYPRVKTACNYPMNPAPSNSACRVRFKGSQRMLRPSASRRMPPLRDARAGFKTSIVQLKRRARAIVPRIRDINLIDKYSRFVFPGSFVLFNLFYWIYYAIVAEGWYFMTKKEKM